MPKNKRRKKPGILMIILAIFFPFIAVLLHSGLGMTFLVNILLCLIGYVPGIVHAIWVLFNK